MAGPSQQLSQRGSTWSQPIVLGDSSDSSAQEAAPLRFEALLYNDYKRVVVFPDLPSIPQGTRWVWINTEHGRSYKVEMLDDGGGFSLQRGWSLVAAIENFHEGQVLMFEQQTEDMFYMWVHRPPHPLPPIGFGPARDPAHYHQAQVPHLIINPGTEIDGPAVQAINQVWHASSDNSAIYVCRLLISPSDGKFLIFNKNYTKLTPKNHQSIAMRFVGSPVIIPGAIKTYTDGNARMVKEWRFYAEQHGLALGKIFACKFVRGPAVWEFIGACAP